MKPSNVEGVGNQARAALMGYTEPSATRAFSWVEDMQNNTGADIVEGSVVVVLADGTVQRASTLNDPRPTGVTLDYIENGETGQVAFGGPVDLVLVTASVTAGQYGQTSATAGQAQVTTGPATAFCMFTTTGTSPEAFLWGGRGGGGIGGGGSVVPFWFNVRDYGALGDGVTNDTVAIQAAITACAAAGGGTVYFPAGLYVISGALQDTGAFNGQLLLPNVSHSGDHIVIRFLGPLRPGFHPVYGDTVPLASGYAVLKSTLTGASGTAAVFSGSNDTGSPSAGHGNNLEIYIDDLVCLGPDNPTFTFWNLAACQGGGVGALQISTPGAFSGSPTQPTNTNAYGIKLPGQYFSNGTPVGSLSVGGFYAGVLAGELDTYDNLVLGPLINGISFTTSFYPTLIKRMQATSVQNILVGTGEHRVDVLQYTAEHSTSPSWAVTVYDVNDASNYLHGFVRWYNAATGGSPDHSFKKNGGAYIGSQEMGSTWGGRHILLADGHATPFTFNDLLQMDDGTDFMWND